MSTFQDLLAHLALEHDREVNSATSTLRKLQRQVAVLRARLSELNSTENHPSDGAESGVTGSGDDELGGGEFESRPGRACEQSLEDKTQRTSRRKGRSPRSSSHRSSHQSSHRSSLRSSNYSRENTDSESALSDADLQPSPQLLKALDPEVAAIPSSPPSRKPQRNRLSTVSIKLSEEETAWNECAKVDCGVMSSPHSPQGASSGTSWSLPPCATPRGRFASLATTASTRDTETGDIRDLEGMFPGKVDDWEVRRSPSPAVFSQTRSANDMDTWRELSYTPRRKRSGSFDETPWTSPLSQCSSYSCFIHDDEVSLLPIWGKSRPTLSPRTKSLQKVTSNSNDAVCGDVSIDASRSVMTLAQPLLRMVVARPGSRRRLCWDVLGIALISYELIVVPMQVFEPPTNHFSQSMLWVTTGFWTLDIFSSFLVGFHNNGVLEMRLGKIGRHYAQTWLAFDVVVVTLDWLIVIGSFVSEARVSADEPLSYMKSARAFRFMRVLRLLRLLKVHGILTEIVERVKSETVLVLVSIAKFIVFIMLINHFIACAWYGLGTWEAGGATWIHAAKLPGRDIGYRYATALHWSLTQFTPASMEVTPTNTMERFFAVCVLVFAMVMFSSFISSITAAMTHLRNLNSEYLEQQVVLRRFLCEKKISTSLVARVWGCLPDIMERSKRRIQEREVPMLSLLPYSLKVDLMEEIFSPTVCRHPLFQALNTVYKPKLRKLFQEAVEEVHLPKSQELFSYGKVAERMYFVTGGSLVYGREGKSEGLSFSVSAGQWVAEPVLWITWKHQGQLISTLPCELCALSAVRFHELMWNVEEVRDYARMFAIAITAHTEDLTDMCGYDSVPTITERAFSESPDQYDGSQVRSRSTPGESNTRWSGWNR